MTAINRTQVAGFTVTGIGIIICSIIFSQAALALIAGIFIGAFLVYAMLQAAPAAYEDEEQAMTEDEILFIYDDV